MCIRDSVTMTTLVASCGDPEWSCCLLEGGAWCTCGFGTECDEGSGEVSTSTCDLESVPPSEKEGSSPICCLDESLEVEGEYDCSCFGGYFDTPDGCDGDFWVGSVSSCTSPPAAPNSSEGSGSSGKSACETSSYTYCGDSSDDDLPCFSGLDCSIINSSGTQRCTIACETNDDCVFAGLSGDCDCGRSEFGCNCLFTECEAP